MNLIKISFLMLAISSCLSVKEKNVSTKVENDNLLVYDFEINLYEQIFFDVYECIAFKKAFFFQGLNNTIIDEEKLNDTIHLTGNYSYNHYIDNLETEIGLIDFKYTINLTKGLAKVHFYDYDHDPKNTGFKPLGILTKNWNEKLAESINKSQYEYIIDSITINVMHFLKMLSKYCIQNN
ncbi:MAG: hypothetical protein P8N07_03610 [Flavobacteriales bacterium]|nr:hypothetical protein [Flavobacteriales bacterium]